MAFSKETAVDAIEEAEAVERSVVRRTEVERSFFHMRKRSNAEDTPVSTDSPPLLSEDVDSVGAGVDKTPKDYKNVTNEDMDMKVSRKDGLVSGIKSRFAKNPSDSATDEVTGDVHEDSTPLPSSKSGPSKLVLIGAAILLLGGGCSYW